MALILEVVHPGGARTWQRLDALPLSLGRAPANDVILDDPYIDARHARIAPGDAGELRIEDLGTLNGLVANEARTHSAIRLEPGVEVRIGRTLLRFRDVNETVAPALLDAPAEPAPVATVVAVRDRRRTPSFAWITTMPASLAVGAFAVAMVAFSSWLGSSERSSAGTAMAAAGMYAFMAAVWAGVWAVASRTSVQRFHYMGHIAVVSAIAVAGMAWTTVEEWLAFLFPDAVLIDVLSTITAVALSGALIAGHLALSSALPPMRRWRLGMFIAASLTAVAGLASYAVEDTFTDVPTFSGVLKPVSPAWVPTSTVGDFGDVMAELKRDVDEMTNK